MQLKTISQSWHNAATMGGWCPFIVKQFCWSTNRPLTQPNSAQCTFLVSLDYWVTDMILHPCTCKKHVTCFVQIYHCVWNKWGGVLLLQLCCNALFVWIHDNTNYTQRVSAVINKSTSCDCGAAWANSE